MTSILPWLGRILLGGVFIFAAVLKLRDPAGFARDIEHYRLLPYPAVLFLAHYLPWLELFAGVAVVLRRLERGALLLLILLCGIFALALGTAWLRGLDISCGCFGQTGPTPGLMTAFARAVALGLLALGLYRTNRPRHTP